MKHLYIETYGCQMNVADSEVVASVMRMAGYEPCDTLDEADAVFLNTCSVRDNAEQKIIHRLEALNALRRKGRKLIIGVLGCMAERVKEGLLNEHHADLVAGPDAYLSLPDLVAQAEAGNKAINIELSTTETYRDIIPERVCGSHVSGFVSIMRGCNNFCHYCIVPYTRGRERSRDVRSILQEVHDLQKRGYKEVTLLGQNVNSYKSIADDGTATNFAALLRIVARAVPEMRIRFSTSHPKDMSDETLHVIAEEPDVCRHIHLPVQSGSDRILKLMNRKYTREWYLDRVAAIRRIVPDCGLSTDIFAGYCTETEEDTSSRSRSCVSVATIRPLCLNTVSALALMPRSISPTTFQKKRRCVAWKNSSPCKTNSRLRATSAASAANMRCLLKAFQNVLANSSSDVRSKTRSWSSTAATATSDNMPALS